MFWEVCKILLLVMAVQSAMASECDVCASLGNNSFPVLTEIQVFPDGQRAQIEVVSCNDSHSTLYVPSFFMGRQMAGVASGCFYALNRGINVIPEIGIIDRRVEIAVTSELGYIFIADMLVPEGPSNLTYQRALGANGLFVWGEPQFGYLGKA